MSSENEKIEQKEDLELGTNDPSHCIWNSGAGANASSRLDMKFVASDALSELVWSPDKGLSLKCADSSFADKHTSLFWDVGPSHMVLAPPQSAIGESSDADKPVAATCIKTCINDIDMNTTTGHPTSDSGVKPEYKGYEERDTDGVLKLPDDQRENVMTGWENKICHEDNTGTAQISQVKGKKSSTISGEVDKRSFDIVLAQADELKSSTDKDPLPRDHANGGRGVGISNQEIKGNNNLCAKDELVTEYKGIDAPGTNLTSSSRGSLEKLESTAENDLRTSKCDAACGASGALVSNSREIENKSQDDEMMLLCDKNLPTMHSPSNRRIQIMSDKGKEKALSDGDVRLSKEDEEDDSHESVESSAGVFSTGKRRWNFQHKLMVESKRFKKQVQESSGPKCFVRQDSSFMSWISNMMKGFSHTVQDGANPSPLTLEHTNHGHQILSPKFITDNKNLDPEPKSVGFQSIFQAIYLPMGTRIASVSHQARDSSEDLSNKAHGIDATPLTFCAENDCVYKQHIRSNESEQSAWRYDVGPSTQPKVEPINVVYSHESSKNDSVENKNCSNLVLVKEKERMMSNSSSGRQNTNNTENIDASVLSKKKEDNMCHRSDALGSLWITRFSRKSTAPLIISNSSKTPEHKFKNEDTGDMYEKAPNDAKNNVDIHNSIHYLNPASPSPKVTNSEPIASVSARRLDAVKYIKPLYRAGSTNHTNMTCLFCGTRGHQLHDCLEIAESELEALLKNINSYGKLEELPSLCIRCFQPNHWAISCPASIQIGQHDLKVNALVNDWGSNETNFNAGKEKTARPLTGEEDLSSPGGAINDKTDPEANQNLDLKWTSDEILPSENIESNAPIKKVFGSSSMEDKLKESSVTSPCGSIGSQISDKTRRIFDAVKKLRLSRTEILKWINSHMSISNLDGFFLRLRLGKWEEGLGGTGYHVACINEARREGSQQNNRKSISVIVGGIKCMVESQYISNHDFLEEELMAWWYTTSKAGNNVPSEEDLIEKIKMKQILGF
ncbi:uncharacterized protein LOC114720810 isoform X2 [Neltuma alba]|uniref:uncharacterized protein LOC114720810 isoform X2 n=1 Tax=Neltuma alba TaxID=207710 RepID=UPI0010A39B93|nr:uncharacterized protein LOC114720810 isoform X2 [Prosopis alba]